MMIHIKNLKAQTLLGAYPAERKAKRVVLINLWIEYDAAQAAISDKLEDALDYAVVEKTILTSLAKQKFHLIEALTAHVAHLVLALERVQEVTVEVEKTGFPEHADSVTARYALSK